jgi:hypothetical protein
MNKKENLEKEKKYKKRWSEEKKLISEIINCLKKKDDSWTTLIKNMKYVNELKGRNDLRGIPLEGKNLESVIFRNIDLRYSNLRNTNLSNAVFENVDLRYSDLSGANLHNTDLRTADIRGAKLENIKVNEGTDWGTHFAWFIKKRKKSQTLIKFFLTQRIIRYLGYKGKIYSEKLAETQEDYRSVKQIYRSLRTAYRVIDPTAADYFFYREFHCELFSLHPKWHPSFWFGILWEKFSCAGTAPLRAFLIIIAFILVCALLYLWVPNGIVRNVDQNNIEEIKNFGEAIYFSFVTFTSLGYGDFHPNHDSIEGQWLKALCCAEAIIGVLSLALFVAIFFRFMSKR